MQQEKKDFLTLAIPPARLNITETAWFLGFTEHDISVLISVGLLKPLGHPPPSGSKYFATAELQSLRNDTRWLAKASDAIVNHWKKKNNGRTESNTHNEHISQLRRDKSVTGHSTAFDKTYSIANK